jgi:5-methylcytosine-specific restriction enzyme B
MFTWKAIYKELAEELLKYRTRRNELIKVLSEGKAAGLHVGKLEDENPKGKSIPLTDIDPFTFFASFNRGTTAEDRKKILELMKDKFQLKSPVAEDFNGIPNVYPQNSWFFAYSFKRGERDIDALWSMADAAISKNIQEVSPGLFTNCIKVKNTSVVNLTMGLFWFKPGTYFALDKKNTRLLNLAGIDPKIQDWDSYIKLLEKVKSELGSDYADISHEAHLIATKKLKWEDSKYNKNPKRKDGENEIFPLNKILYGPPGTGKTYSSFSRAVKIIDGTLPEGKFEVVKRRFDELVEKKQISFVTFHQSYSYEDFVEGFRPVKESDKDVGGLWYECRDGIFKNMCKRAEEIASKNAVIDLEKGQIWKMSLGHANLPEEKHIYDECISGGFIAHGSGRGRDFSECKSKEDIQKALSALDWKKLHSTLSHNVSQIHLFKHEMKIGDLVIVSDGNDKFRAIGQVSGEYTYDPKFDYGQKRPVVWLKVFEESQPVERILKDKRFSQLALYQLFRKNLKFEDLRDLLNQDEVGTNKRNYVLIIDEINRGNISKIMGELITLLEEDKRMGAKHELQVMLPYSQKPFGVPNNVYILGTMNTADKSIALVDIALRRRFVFEELIPDFSICEALKPEMRDVLNELNKRIVLRKDRDHRIGHSYFMDVQDTESFNKVFETIIIPLLQEYFWNDWEGLRFVLGEDAKDQGKFILRITEKNIPSARNKWQWFSDVRNEPIDYLAQLQKNYSFESTNE